MDDQSLWERPLPLAKLIPLGIELATLLAERHAVGRSGGLDGLSRDQDDALRLGSEDINSSAKEDIRALARLLLEAVLTRLPQGRELTDEHLLGHICMVEPNFPPDLAAVLSDMISPDPALRPADAIELWAWLARAQANYTVRNTAPTPDLARWILGHDTHIGLYKSRLGQTNQDHLFYQSTGRVAILVVADGISISTAGSGNLASTILIQVIASLWESQKEELRTGSDGQIRAFLDEALAVANNTICNGSLRLANGKLRQHIPMGTTAVVAVIQGANVHLANLGDSRAYLLGSSGVGLLTGDQNLRGEWLRTWQTNMPIELHNEGHALVGYAGHFDIHGTPAPLPAVVRKLRMLPGESLLLCSDGFNDYAADTHATLARLIDKAMQHGSPTEATRELVGYANSGGGGDNVTVLIATCTGS